MAESRIVYTPLSEIIYARAFFLTSPGEHPLMPGETRQFPAKYTIGAHEKATAFRLDWYENQTDADARQNVVTEFGRVPTHAFLPEIPNPNARPDALQDVSIALTGPEADANAFLNPVAVLLMEQVTRTIAPYLYLESEAITIPAVVTDYRFKYAVGDPPATAFVLKWFATRLDALLMVDELTDTDRLPKALFIPGTPSTDFGAEVFQNGVLRLTPSTHMTPYTSAVGLLCMEQHPVERGTTVAQTFAPGEHRQRQDVYSNWRRK